MQKRKLFIAFTAIITISFIGLSAQCGIGITGQVPTIALDIYDGPEYSEPDDMCYYKVEAIVTGMPEPEIEFDVDDNVDLIGPGRVEVYVAAGDSYTLTATATNPQGTASFSIVLKGEYNEATPDEEVAEEEVGEREVAEEATEDSITEQAEEEPEPEQESEPVEEENDEDSMTGAVEKGPEQTEVEEEPERTRRRNLAIWPDESMSGMIIAARYVRLGTSPILIGDTIVGNAMKGYLSFDISALHGVDVQICTIQFKHIGNSNHPESFASNIVVKVFDYGDSLDASDFAVGGTQIASIPVSDTNFIIWGTGPDPTPLRNELQKAIDAGRDYFQLKLGLDAITNGDDIIDTKDIYNCSEDVELYITYLE